MRASRIVSLICTVAASWAHQAQAQPYPSKPIHVILAIAAGGVQDVVMRVAAPDLQTFLGQPLIIENRPGGNQMIGANACAKAAPDGYTICALTNFTLSVSPHLVPDLSYDVVKDYKPITNLYYFITGVITSAALPATSVKELQALVRANPGSLNLGTMGAGTTQDIFRQWLNDSWNANIVGIPYKGGNLIMAGLASGEIQLSRISLSTVGGLAKAGKVKVLAVGSSKRSKLYPDVPTYAEVGLNEFTEQSWTGLLAPAGVSDAIVRRINADFGRLFRLPKFQDYLEEQWLDPAFDTPENFAAFLKLDRERSGAMIKKYNVKLQ